MNALESPLEALAFEYLTFGLLTAVNSLWAWIAVLTAAVSFWKIRASSSPPPPATAQLAPVIEIEAEKRNVSFDNSTATTSFRVLEREGSTKVKFTLHYECDVNDERSDGGDGIDDVSDGTGDDDEEEELRWWCDDRERMRMGDLGWYTCQDLTVLDGSVVRLWGDGKRRRGQVA